MDGSLVPVKDRGCWLLKVCRGPAVGVYVSPPGASKWSRDSIQQFRVGKAVVSGGTRVRESGGLVRL